MQPPRPKRITAVWTRDVNTDQIAGRLRTILSIREAMQAHYEVKNLRLDNLLERRNLRAVAAALLAAITSVFRGVLPPLQCLLYSDSRNHRAILRALESNPPDTLYCDGIRCLYFLRRLTKTKTRMRIVVDFDDLMSRRMETLCSSNVPLSLGYLNEKTPLYLRFTVGLGFVSRFLARYESIAVQRAENSIGKWADVITLVSCVEADALRSRFSKLGFSAEVKALPPPIDIVHTPRPYAEFSHFIFIGPDSLPQNRLTIQLIQSLWQTYRPEAEIHIFGRMSLLWKPVRGVVFRGYAKKLDEVYAEGTVLFSPGTVRGGIKTKVIESFAFGCAVVGNDITFEGLDMMGYPLVANSDMELTQIVVSPSIYLDAIRQAARIGQEYVQSHLSRKRFKESWNRALG